MSLSVFGKKSVVGIDLGHYSIKVVQLERTASGWKVLHADSAATPANSIKDGVVVDSPAVTEALKALLKKSHLHVTSANISVSGGSVVVRTVRIPKMPEATLRKSIKYEAGRYVPSSVEDSFIEFEIVREADDAQMEVLVVAAPKDIVESRVNACEAAGLEVEVVDVEAFALYRALVEADLDADWSEASLALIDIGSSTTNVSVVSRGAFAMTRSISQGGAMLTEALRNYFKLNDEEAEAGKAQLDFRDLLGDQQPGENPPLRVLQPHVDDLIREIRRSLNYYQSQQTDGAQANPVTNMIVSGGGAKLKGLAEYIADKLGLQVHAASVRDNSRFAFDQQIDALSGPELTVASGLAMRAFAGAA